MDVVSFLQEEHWYGVDSGAVVGLLPTACLRPLEHPSRFVVGQVQFEGRLALAPRLAALLGAQIPEPSPSPSPPVDPAERVSLIIVGRPERLLGLSAESIGAIVDIRRSNIRDERRDDDPSRVLKYRLDRGDHCIDVLDVTHLGRLVDLALGGSGPSAEEAP